MTVIVLLLVSVLNLAWQLGFMAPALAVQGIQELQAKVGLLLRQSVHH